MIHRLWNRMESARKCKADYAAVVRAIMPLYVSRDNPAPLNNSIIVDICSLFCEQWLDCSKDYGIIVLTVGIHKAGGNLERWQTERWKERGTAWWRSAEPACRAGERRSVRRGRILRCSGSCTGQVRDAAQGQNRRCQRNRGGERFRHVALLVLPSPDGIRKNWITWADAEEAGTARTTQTDARGSGVRAGGTSWGSVDRDARAAGSDRGAFRTTRSPAHDRAGLGGREKKTTNDEVAGRSVIHSAISRQTQELTDRYEALRASRAASRERELFIRRGMTAWLAAWLDCSPGCGVEVARNGREDMANRTYGGHAPALPEGLHGQVTELLAGIAWTVARS